MLPDIELARQTAMRPIADVAASVGIQPDEILNYGRYKAKLDLQALSNRLSDKPDGKLILVTAINPTPAGEGKTTTTVGLGQAFCRLGKNAVLALREPSLGPVFGLKGGAAGGGYAQVLPMEDINLHFTGDIHAITAANNLCAAMLDNHLQQGNALRIDPRQIVWKRCLDINDRSLRYVVVGLGGKANGVPREEQFQISVASEIMAVFCLADSFEDLTNRLARIIVAYNVDNEPVTARDLKADGAMAVLLKDAFNPNLVQTMEQTPVLMHGGPFANIAHGCNSLAATKLGLKLGDYLITEAGFGADLGAEKFLDIKCRLGGLAPAAAVIVATIRSLKYNGGVPKDRLNEPDLEALARGLGNLDKHIENMARFGLPAVVAVNRFPRDTEAENVCIKAHCQQLGVPCCLSDVFVRGGEGGLELARCLLDLLEKRPAGGWRPVYDLDDTLEAKIDRLARTIYGAASVRFMPTARKSLERITAMGYGHLPICMAKTQYSLSDQPHLLGRPEGFELTVREATLSAGAGFVVCLAGDVMTMPGLPARPAAEQILVDADGQIQGLF